MSQGLTDVDALYAYNKECRDLPAFTADEREEFLKWIDHIQATAMNVFYATAPDDLWQNNDVYTFILIGQPIKNNTEIPRGIYCVDIPAKMDRAYRDPIALAFAHLGKTPDHFKFSPSALSVVLPKPTAHERFAAKMFFKKLMNDNPENKDLCDWASKLN